MNKLESTIKIGRQSTANGSAKGKTKAVVENHVPLKMSTR